MAAAQRNVPRTALLELRVGLAVVVVSVLAIEDVVDGLEPFSLTALRYIYMEGSVILYLQLVKTVATGRVPK